MPLPRGDRLPLAIVTRAHHDDEPGEIVGVAAEAVPQPAPRRRPPRHHGAGVHEGVGGIVVDRLGVEALHNRDPVGDPRRDLRKDRADLLAAVSRALERVLGSEALQRLPLELGDLLPLGEALRHRLAIHGGELRLVVEGVEVGHTAGHVEPDHPLRPRRHMVRPDHPRPLGQIFPDRRGCLGLPPAPEEGAEGEGPEAAGGAGEERTPGRVEPCREVAGSRIEGAHGVSSWCTFPAC